MWGYDYFGGTRTVDVHVRRLRAKLGADHESLIGTVRNVGYRFVADEDAAKPDARVARRVGPPGVGVLTLHHVSEVDALPAGVEEQVRDCLAEAIEADGLSPLSEQATLLLSTSRAGLRHLVLEADGETAGYAQLDVHPHGRVAELFVAPGRRGGGGGRALAAAVLAAGEGTVSFWAHGNLPGARALAAEFGFAVTRELRMMRRSLDGIEEVPAPDGVRIRPYVSGRDDAAWLDVNRRAFAEHPEQGRWAEPDLHARTSLAGFNPAGLLLAERADGTLAGFHWTKVHEHGHHGEVYVLGVDPSSQGTGLGRVAARCGPAPPAGAGNR